MFLMKFLFFFLNDNCANCGQGLYSPAAALCQQNICSCGLRLKKNRNIRFYQDLTIFACFAQLCLAFKAVDLISRHLITKAVSIRSSLQFANAQKRFCLPKLSKRQLLIFTPFAFQLLWRHSSAHLPLQRYGVSVVTRCKQLRRVLELSPSVNNNKATYCSCFECFGSVTIDRRKNKTVERGISRAESGVKNISNNYLQNLVSYSGS